MSAISKTTAPPAPPVVLAGRLAMLLAAAGVTAGARVDPDLWGHLRFGLDLLHTGRLTSIDPYSFTQDRPWINHEWLSELLLAVAYSSAGMVGMMVLKILVLATAFWLLADSLRGIDPAKRGWVMGAIAIGLVPIALTFRPQLWTILGVTLLLSMLDGRRSLKWMPLLFAFWANLHGGWIVGAGITGLWMVGRVIDERRIAAAWPVAGILALSIAATLVNPYGWKLWAFLLETVRMSRPDITEWRPYWDGFKPSHVILWPLTVAILGFLITTRWRSLTWAALLPTLWLTVSGLFVSRLAPLSGLMLVFCAAQGWRASAATAANPRLRWSPTMMIDAMAVAALVVPMLVQQRACLTVDDIWTPDHEAAAALEDPSLTGRLVVPFDWGEFAIWHWAPRLRVSMDGRRETVYSEAMITLQRHVGLAEADGLEFLARERPEYAWVKGNVDAPLGTWLTGNGYRVDVRTPLSFIASRADLPVVAAKLPLKACFP